jgi:hypothetical protein
MIIAGDVQERQHGNGTSILYVDIRLQPCRPPSCNLAEACVGEG